MTITSGLRGPSRLCQGQLRSGELRLPREQLSDKHGIAVSNVLQKEEELEQINKAVWDGDSVDWPGAIVCLWEANHLSGSLFFGL